MYTYINSLVGINENYIFHNFNVFNHQVNKDVAYIHSLQSTACGDDKRTQAVCAKRLNVER